MEFHKLKNYINNDTLSDWFDIMHDNLQCFKKDVKNTFVLKIQKEKDEYKNNFINNFRNDIFYENLNHNEIKKKIKNHEIFICYRPRLYNSKYSIYITPDIIFHKELFLKYFPEIKINLPEYLICDILYKIVDFNADKTDILNKNNIYYNKCKIFAACNSLNIKSGFFLGKEYRHRENILNKKENIGLFVFKNEYHDIIMKGLKWFKKLNDNYKSWKIYPQPSIDELYPNMNYKETDWKNEKRILAELIKEITLVWNISYNERCNLFNKDIRRWDHHLLLNNIYNYKIKEYRNYDIQNKMININLNDEIDIKPRRIKNYDFIQIIKNQGDSIILDIESVINMEKENDYFKEKELIKIPKIAIIGTIINNNDCIFKDFTVKYISNDEEKKIINYWINYLFKFFKKEPIKVYHWGNAEKVYINYMKEKYKDIEFPNFIMIDLLSYFKLEPIVIKGCFGYGLKEIVKTLYDLKYINNIWIDDIDGLNAMIKIMEISELSRNSNIPIKRFSEISDIIYYNYIDCRVLVDILQMLEKMI